MLYRKPIQAFLSDLSVGDEFSLGFVRFWISYRKRNLIELIKLPNYKSSERKERFEVDIDEFNPTVYLTN